VISAVAVAGLAVSTYAQTNSANVTSSTATADSTSSGTSDNTTSLPPWGMGMMIGDQGFGPGQGGMATRGGRGDGFGGPLGSFQVSSAYNQTISNILGNDSDVQKLISQGYNVSSIRPILSSTVNADGTVTTKASVAIVTMQNGTSGFATVSVDITNAKVTQIIIITKTVIDKSATATTTS